MANEGRRQMLIVSSAAMSLFLISFDMNMVNIALPTIAAHHGLGVADSAWLVIVYGVVLCSLLLPFGKAGDVIGHRRLFIVGMALFSVSNLASGLSIIIDDFLLLVLLRGGAAVGLAMMVSVNFAIVSLNLPEKVRGKGMGYFSVFGAVGFMIGPLASGLIISNLHWNAIFFVSASLGVIGLMMAWRYIPDTGGDGLIPDIAQTVAMFIGILSAVLALNRVLVDGVSETVISSAALAIVSFIIVYNRQRSAARPLLEPAIIRNPAIMLPLVCMSLIYMSYSGSMVLLPFYLDYVEGLDAATMGLLFLFPALMVMILGPIAGSYADRHGSYFITLTGTTVMVLSMAVFVFMGRLDGVIMTTAGLLLMGISHGLFNAPNNRRVFCIVPMQHVGTASGMHQMIRQVGNVIGAATLPAVYQAVAGPSPSMSSMINGFETGFALALGFAVLAVILSLRMRMSCRG